MPTKARVNAFLARTTGYHLTKGTPGGAQARHAAAPPAKKAAAKKVAPPAKQAAEKQAAAKPAEEFPVDYDDDVREIIRAVRPYTMTRSDKLHALVTATKYIVRYDIPGDIVECGVWRGGSMHAVARTLTAVGDQSRDLYLFDTFEGMPPPSDKDVRHDGAPADQLLSEADRTRSVWAVAGLDDVKAGFATVPYPAERIHYVQGKVEDTVPTEVPEQIAILRLDTDWYESTAHELTHMYDRLVSGGVLMIDDYGHWKGSRQATDEFLDRTGARLLLLRMNVGRVAVKP